MDNVQNTPAPAQAAEAKPSAEQPQVEGQEVEQEEAVEAKPQETKKEKEKRLKKLKLKVDNKEFEETIDLDDDEALVRHLQMSKMGQKRAQEKTELEKEVKSFLENLQSNPFGVLKDQFKFNMDDLVNQYIEQQLENAKKTPEQIQKEQLELELQTLKKQRENEKADYEKRELERLEKQEFERIDMQMTQALEKTELPKTPYTVKKLAEYMIAAAQAGYEMPIDELIPLVKEEIESDIKTMFQVLPEDKVEAILGEQVLEKLRKKRIQKAKDSQKLVGKPAIVETGNSKEENKSKEKKMTYRDFFR